MLAQSLRPSRNLPHLPTLATNAESCLLHAENTPRARRNLTPRNKQTTDSARVYVPFAFGFTTSQITEVLREDSRADLVDEKLERWTKF